MIQETAQYQLTPEQLLQKFFGYDSFRPGQIQIIESILTKKDTIAIMPTGGGKSICYQIPALIFPNLTIVISPLIALMKDQVDVLKSKNIPAAYINSSISQGEINYIYYQLQKNEIKLLYLAPERINSKAFLELLKSVRVDFIAIDEAHCISEWGHDFRPSYREIKTLSHILPNAIIGAFTATATPEVKKDIENSLSLEGPLVVQKSFDRDNLSYHIEYTDNKLKSISDIVKNSLAGSVMIYAGSRNRVEKYYSYLKSKFEGVSYYHAGLNEKYRKQVQEYFLQGKSNIIVATSAFGMGIDKSNVRAVIHTDLTPTLESYYQEAGRAGRDGKPAKCYIVYQEGDRSLQDFFISINYPPLEKIQKVYNYLYNKGGVNEGEFPKKIISDEIGKLAVETNIDTNEFRSIVKFLERQNVLKWGKGLQSIRLRVIASRERIINFFENCDDSTKSVLESILRSMPATELNEFQTIDASLLQSKYNITKDKLDKSIKKLEFSEIIESNQKRANGIHLLLARATHSELPFDTRKFLEMKHNIIQKLNQVEDYIKTNTCKRNFILNYFGESNSRDCGKCSFCKGIRYQNIEEMDKYIERVLKDAISLSETNKSKPYFKDLLLGSNTIIARDNDFKSNSFYGELKGVSKKDFDKAWNAIASGSIGSNRIADLIAGYSFKEICEKENKKPSILAKELLTDELNINQLCQLFSENEVTLIDNYIKENPKTTARKIQHELNLSINFIEIKLILHHLKKK